MSLIFNEYLFKYSIMLHYWRKQSIKTNIHYETHHIVPKSLGGSNEKTNLIKIPAKIHFLFHILLPHFLENEDKTKMLYAWNMLSNFSKITNFNEYEFLKKEWSKASSKKMKNNIPWNKGLTGCQIPWNKGKAWSNEIKEKIKISNLNNDYVCSAETKQKISDNIKGEKNPMFGLKGSKHPKTGFKESDETKRKKSEAQKGKIFSKEHKKNISKSWAERKKKKLTCPHCEFSSCNNMTRYHFDNCKQKENK